MSATLIIYFCSFKNVINPYKEFIILDNNKEICFKTNEEKIEIKLSFNEYEIDLGHKVCYYMLRNALYEKDQISGVFDLYLGNNIGYCFIDEKGLTFELLFLKKDGKIDEFLQKKFFISRDPEFRYKIEIKPNKIDTKDRANLLLINCLSDCDIKIDGEVEINMDKIYTEMKYSYQLNRNFQICFYNDNFENYTFRQINQEKEINFEALYQKKYEEVNDIYNFIIQEINNKNGDAEKIANFFLDKYDNYREDIDKIIKKKFIYSPNILKKYLNNNDYIDFTYKIVFLNLMDKYIEEKENEEDKNEKGNLNLIDIKDKYSKFILNKDKICEDALLENYEKILLLMELSSSKIIFKEEYEIKYLNYKNIENNSPMYYAYKFLNNFIKELDYDSNFYYPLLSIDSGKFEYKYEKDGDSKNISIFGFNMFSLDTIKEHMKNMIPNILILSKYINPNDDASTNFSTGNIILNSSKLKVDLTKRCQDGIESKHYGFLISRILIHEIFGHKKSSYSHFDLNEISIISFKNESGQIQILSEDFNYAFKNIDEIVFSNIREIIGESGYFIEYHLGKINDFYTFDIIDLIEDKTNLSVLLDAKFWHKDISVLQEYVKLKYIMIYKYNIKIIDNKLNIYEQIKKMKDIIANDNDEDNNDDKSQVINKNELNDKINKRFNECTYKNRKKRLFSEAIQKKKENRPIKNIKKTYLFNGFYKK